MADVNYTNLLGLAQPETGKLAGVWGDVVNNQLTQLLEDSVAGAATKDVTAGDWVLSTTGGGVQNESRMAVLVATGTPGVPRSIEAPAASKAYFVVNQTGEGLTIKASGTTGVLVPPNVASVVVWDGSDFRNTAISSIGISVPTGMTVANSPLTSDGVMSIGVDSGYFIPKVGEVSVWSAPAVKTSVYVAEAGDQLGLDTTGGIFNVVLPTSPDIGDKIRFIDIMGSWGDDSPVLMRNGKKIQGQSDDLELDVKNGHFMLMYINAAIGWVVVL